MNGLYYHNAAIENSTSTTLSLLRFYDNGYVIFKKVTGDKEYFSKELKKFTMNGHAVNGEPEFTFCGGFEDFGNGRISFKVENEIRDPSNTWAEKEILSFKGIQIGDRDLKINYSSKQRKYEVEQMFQKTTDQDLLNEI